MTTLRKLLFISLGLVTLFSCSQTPSGDNVSQSAATANADTSKTSEPEAIKDFVANQASPSPKIDGLANDSCWQKADWYPMNQRWIGTPYTPEDFSGRYKLAWDKNYLYVLAEITDDTLIDFHEGLNFYWDDDCLEIFVDENHSGGNHQYNYNAFAYHIALDGKVADMGPDSTAHYFNDHVSSKRSCQGHSCIWECAVKLYSDAYKDGAKNVPMVLQSGKVAGFAIAYCDNDHSKERENFVGSVYVPGEDKNRGWIDAGIFGTLTLK